MNEIQNRKGREGGTGRCEAQRLTLLYVLSLFMKSPGINNNNNRQRNSLILYYNFYFQQFLNHIREEWKENPEEICM